MSDLYGSAHISEPERKRGQTLYNILWLVAEEKHHWPFLRDSLQKMINKNECCNQEMFQWC